MWITRLSAVVVLGLQLAEMAMATAPAQYLNLTTISAANGASTLECWQLTTPITVSSTAGTAGAKVEQLGNVANMSFSAIPGKFSGGLHNAPAPQYVAFLSGLAHVTLPNSTDEAWVPGGAKGLILAVDTSSLSTLGHNTTYPTNEVTTVLQIPTANGQIPAHTVLHSGACKPYELTFGDSQPPSHY